MNRCFGALLYALDAFRGYLRRQVICSVGFDQQRSDDLVPAVLRYPFHDAGRREARLGVVVPAFLHRVAQRVKTIMIPPVIVDPRSELLRHNVFLHLL